MSPHDEPPFDPQQGPSGADLVLATVGMFAIVGAIFILLGLGGSVAVAGALVLMVAGVIVVSRYVQRIAWTRGSPAQPRRSDGSDADSAAGDEAHSELSPYDIPRQNPARQELEHRAAMARAHPHAR